MEVLYFNSLESTQTYLVEGLKSKALTMPICIMAKEQTAGIGSRNNSWEGGEGNLFFSFALNLDDLPNDLPLSSASIYFSFIMKKMILKYDDSVWLKWPNDLYQNSYKIGGTITKKIDNILLCGMGINLQKNSNSFKALNLNVEPIFLLEEYLSALEEYPSWKQIFSEYRVEFERSKEYFTHVEGVRKSLKNAILSEDGSLIIENKRVYSIR
ncbi:MAG: Biotin-protein ligase [uncultured Sulfurovum sp.]|uniref:Biotin-protein ligase n=1 Tax=uncultured Sulfurovum sp. TaxID=269237 RepID=A0A6S6TET2_9BACT|nr:MAG: Biotin-protein ligase [uncultured Sulfurovum sp.]